MAFLDDDETAFQAALCFVDEFSFDRNTTEGPSRVVDSSVGLHEGSSLSTPVVFGSDAYKLRRRDQINERRRLLRKNAWGTFASSFDRQLDNAYHAMDALFAANGLAAMSLSPADVHMREDVDGRYLECFSHKLLPFAMGMTTDATWEHFKGVEKHFGNGSLYEKTAKVGSGWIIENFTKELYSGTSRADIHVKQVVRRYVEPDRDVVIWVARVAPAEIKHKMLRGLTYHLRGYAVTKKSPKSRPAEELSVLQQCSLISLDQDAAMRCNPSDLHALTNFLVVNTAQNIRAHRELIENALIDGSVARRKQ